MICELKFGIVYISSSFLRRPQSCWWLFRHFRGCSQKQYKKSTFQLWSQVLKFVHCLNFLLSEKTTTCWLVSGRRLTQTCQQSSPLLYPWRESSNPWWCGVKRNRFCTVFWWWCLMRQSWWQWVRRWRDGSGTSLVLMMGHWNKFKNKNKVGGDRSIDVM